MSALNGQNRLVAMPTPWEEGEKEDAGERERIEERAAGQVGSDVCAEGRRVNSPQTRGAKRDFVPLVCRRTRCMAGNPFEREAEGKG